MALVVKNLPANAGDVRDRGLIPGLGRSPEGGQPTPVLLPSESPWTEEPGGLQSTGSHRVGHRDLARTRARTHTHTHTQPHKQSMALKKKNEHCIIMPRIKHIHTISRALRKKKVE